MSESVEQPEPTIEQNQTSEERQSSLIHRTSEFYKKHATAQIGGILGAIGGAVIGGPFGAGIGAGIGIAAGEFSDRKFSK